MAHLWRAPEMKVALWHSVMCLLVLRACTLTFLCLPKPQQPLDCSGVGHPRSSVMVPLQLFFSDLRRQGDGHHVLRIFAVCPIFLVMVNFTVAAAVDALNCVEGCSLWAMN